MKTRLLIIIGVLIIAITSTFILNYYNDEEIKSQKFSDEQLDEIFKRCDYQKRMDDRNWIGSDGNEITDEQPFYVLRNSTHLLDNNICKWMTIEKYEYDANLKDALGRCWVGNSEFLDDDFVLWSNETHYINKDTCLITEAIHSGMSIDRTVYPVSFGMTQEELEMIQQILKKCADPNKDKLSYELGFAFRNQTHYIDNNICEWQKIK